MQIDVGQIRKVNFLYKILIKKEQSYYNSDVYCKLFLNYSYIEKWAKKYVSLLISNISENNRSSVSHGNSE